ncbi:MAG: hypothetical protein MJ214_01605 [Bacilli bacterium]|nr:hypothetical protein [Bacilli bacterium]
MLDFLKRFGLGILYVLISPFIIAFLVLWAIFNLGIFFMEIAKGFISFFKGKKFFPDFQEDVEAKRILSLEPYANDNANVEPQPQPQTQVPPTDNNQNNNGGNSSL